MCNTQNASPIPIIINPHVTPFQCVMSSPSCNVTFPYQHMHPCMQIQVTLMSSHPLGGVPHTHPSWMHPLFPSSTLPYTSSIPKLSLMSSPYIFTCHVTPSCLTLHMVSSFTCNIHTYSPMQHPHIYMLHPPYLEHTCPHQSLQASFYKPQKITPT